MSLNKVLLIGNLTKDPEVRSTGNGTSVASFNIATNLVWTDQSGQRQERAEYHNIVVWRKLAEIAGQYLKKGSKVYIEGRLQTRSWEDQSAVKRYRTEIIAENLIMLDGKSSMPAGSSDNSFQNNNNEAAPKAEMPEPEINLEDIPF